jgi:class 3 adenylate cyclase/predicted ATPase
MNELDQVQQAISTLEAQRSVLGDAVVDLALGPLQERLRSLQGTKPPEKQLKLATMLFIDVVGYTALTRHLDPEELMEVMDGVLGRLSKPVERNGGRIVRFQGDGFKAVFGIPLAHENDAKNAVQAGLAVQEIARDIAEELERERGLVGFSVRVGIATGLIMAGGGNEKEDSVMGEPVNLAARLESAARPGTVLISHQTFLQVRGIFEIEELGKREFKGFPEPMSVYQVQKARPPSFRTRRRGVEGVETRMVGRENELNIIQSLYSLCLKDSNPTLITILGEPGIGKSRLLYEFENWAEVQPQPVKIYRARARLETHYKPYSLLHELISTEFEIYDSDSESVAKEKLENGISRWTGSREWASFIGHILGFDYSESAELKGILEESQQIRDQAFHAAAQVLLSGSNNSGILILLEDLHWADEGSLNFIKYIFHHFNEFPLFIVCAARSTILELHPDWEESHKGWMRLSLTPLTIEENQRLINEILRKAIEIPPLLNELILRQAEGNPFYVEELIKMFVDDGVITTSPGDWIIRKDKFGDGKVPQTLAGVIQARLDALPMLERKVLDRASVVGRIFWQDLVAYMRESNMSENGISDIVDPSLNKLQNRELVFQRDQSSFSEVREYIFKNAIFRDVVYERLLKKQRQAYHEQAAEWLCKYSGERVGEFAGRIAEHYDLADQKELAADWYIRAGKQAKESYALEMAKAYYKKGLSLLKLLHNRFGNQISKIIDASFSLNQVMVWQGNYLEAVEGYRFVLREAEQLQDGSLQAKAWHGIAEAQMHRGDFRAAIESADRSLVLARHLGENIDLSKAMWMKAWGAFRLGEKEQALTLAEQVAKLSQQLQEPSQIGQSFNLLGVLQSTIGNYSKAADYFEQALSIFRKAGNRLRALPLMNNLGVIAEARGDYKDALNYYQDALKTAREIGNRDGEMVYLSNLGGVKVHLGDYPSAEDDLVQVIHMTGSEGLDVLSSTYSYLAQAYLGQSKSEEALAAAQSALSIAQEMEAPDDLGLAWRVLGQIAAFVQQPIPTGFVEEGQRAIVGAEECFAESERVYKEIEREDERARTLNEWALYKYSVGDYKQGALMCYEAKDIFQQLGVSMELNCMEENHAS